MFGSLFSAPAWHLILQADIMSKLILLSLFVLSIICIWVVLSKYLLFKKEKKVMTELLNRLRKVSTFNELLAVSKEFHECAGGRFLVGSLGALKDLLQPDGGNAPLDQQHVKLTAQNFEYLQILVEQTIEEVIAQEEEYMPVLGTSFAVSPLIGLFGTIWGLIHSFIDISQTKSADISVVAPGIAEALTTTLAGLIVAIPAGIFFHYFANQIRTTERQVFNISDKFLNIVKQTFLH